MECRHGNFWIGLGIGSILGAVAYRLSRTAKARQLESDIYNAIHRIGRDAEIAAAEAERKAMNLGLKAVETGAKVADKVAEEADKAVGKAKEKWEKLSSLKVVIRLKITGYHFSFILIAFFLKIYLNQILSLSLISVYA